MIKITNKNQDQLYFHVYNRGVEKRDIFMDKSDYYRFIHDLYEFNDTSPTNPNRNKYYGSSTSINYLQNKENLVTVLCFCLMPNHYHLLLSVPDKQSLTIFMRKIGTGYTNYFNKKYDRVGSLFQGRYKYIQIENDDYLKHLSRYIHLNPQNSKRLKNIALKQYKYSSYLDYIGVKNFPSIINSDLILSQFDATQSYKDFVNEGLSYPLGIIEQID